MKGKVAKNKMDKMDIFILVVFAVPIGAVILLILCPILIDVIKLNISPEQSVQVEIVGKRIREYQSPGTGEAPSKIYSTYIVAFKFTDGSVKELEVAYTSRDPKKKEGPCYIYDSLHEGDTGILIYKEIENIEEKCKNEEMRYDYRLFVRFTRDS